MGRGVSTQWGSAQGRSVYPGGVCCKFHPIFYILISPTGLLCYLCQDKNSDEQIYQSRHRHIVAAVEKGILKHLILCLYAIVCVVVELAPDTECLNPHLQNKKKQQFRLPTIFITIHYEATLPLFTFFFGTHCCV